jgi:hypothetical protein
MVMLISGNWLSYVLVYVRDRLQAYHEPVLGDIWVLRDRNQVNVWR